MSSCRDSNLNLYKPTAKPLHFHYTRSILLNLSYDKGMPSITFTKKARAVYPRKSDNTTLGSIEIVKEVKLMRTLLANCVNIVTTRTLKIQFIAQALPVRYQNGTSPIYWKKKEKKFFTSGINVSLHNSYEIFHIVNTNIRKT